MALKELTILIIYNMGRNKEVCKFCKFCKICKFCNVRNLFQDT